MLSLMAYVKTALRVRSTAYDELEIIPIIEACKKDLAAAGVGKIDDSDPLIIRAAILYAKGSFGFNADSEKYIQAYEALKISLSLAGEYHG